MKGIKKYIIPTANLKRFLCKEVDTISRQIYPNDAPSNLILIQVLGDRNCLYRSLSILLYGHDQYYQEMRTGIVTETIVNAKLYAEKKRGKKKKIIVQNMYKKKKKNRNNNNK